MALTYERIFSVRAYECDAFGHVNHANYLRYMQEAAIEASASIGYDTARYAALGSLWLIRSTDIEYEQPLYYGDRLILRTWVDDMRQVRSRRMYTFHKAGSDAPVARASTDWVYMDRRSLRPQRIPAEIAGAYCPGGCDEEAPPAAVLDLPEPPEGRTHRMVRDVAWRDIDHVGHVNNAVYLSYNEDAGLDAARAHGWDLAEMFMAGWGIFTRRNTIEYTGSARLGDRLEVATWLSQPGSTSIRRYFLVSRVSDGAVLARTETVWVLVGLDDGRPIPIPDVFLRRFAGNMMA